MQLTHVNIIPKMGVLPLSHMGHKIDLLPVLQALGGYSYVNLAPNDVFTPDEQQEVISRQWQDPNIRFFCYSNVGDFLKVVFGHHTFDKINIVVGQDRVRWAERIVDGLKRESFKELDCITANIQTEIVIPDTYREHGFSGTTMREAALIGDLTCFKAHLGDTFNDHESYNYYCVVRRALVEEKIPLRRRG